MALIIEIPHPKIIINDTRIKPSEVNLAQFEGEVVSDPVTPDDLPEILRQPVGHNFGLIQEHLGSLGVEVPADWTGNEMLGFMANSAIAAIELKFSGTFDMVPAEISISFPDEITTSGTPEQVAFTAEKGGIEYSGKIYLSCPNTNLIGLPQIVQRGQGSGRDSVGNELKINEFADNNHLTSLGEGAITLTAQMFFPQPI